MHSQKSKQTQLTKTAPRVNFVSAGVARVPNKFAVKCAFFALESCF